MNGSFDFSNGYNFSTGNGSYFLGFQAGYDYMTASRWLFGVETDISFPSFVGGNRTFSSVPTGMVNNLERVEFSGNVLGRVGYAPSFGASHWLFYAHRRLGLQLRSIHPHAACRRAGGRHRGARHDRECYF